MLKERRTVVVGAVQVESQPGEVVANLQHATPFEHQATGPSAVAARRAAAFPGGMTRADARRGRIAWRSPALLLGGLAVAAATAVTLIALFRHGLMHARELHGLERRAERGDGTPQAGSTESGAELTGGWDYDQTVIVRRPPAAVYAILADQQDYGDHSPDSLVPVLEKVPHEPTHAGTRWHEVVRLTPSRR